MSLVNDELITRGGGAVRSLGGAVSAGGGIIMTGTGAASCGVTFGAGCAVALVAGVPLTALGAMEMDAGWQTVTGNYVSTHGQRVLDSFSIDTHQGHFSVLESMTERAAIFSAEMLSGRIGGKYFVDTVARSRAVGVDDVVINSKTLPGPAVPEYHLGNYTDGIAVNRQVSGDEIFYKYHGRDNRLGKTHNYVTQKQYTSEVELRNDLAILDEWGIEIDRVTTFKPPKGTWVSEGTAAKQVGDFTDEFRPGGGYQGLIDINNLPKSSWIKTDKLPAGFKQ